MTLHFAGQFLLITNQVRAQGQKWTVWKIKDTECGHGHTERLTTRKSGKKHPVRLVLISP